MKKIIFIFLLFGLLLRLVNLDQSLWLDEAAQAIESAGPFAGLFKIYADFMPPLFHILLHFWLKMGSTEVWLRFLPVIFSIGSIYFTFRVAQHFFLEKIAILAVLLLALSPFHIYYSQEVRPYSLAAFLSILATYYLVKKKYLKYTLSAILLIYSLYTTPFLLLAHGVYIAIFVNKDIKRWLLTMLLVGLSFVPWLPIFWRQLTGGSGLTSLLPGWAEAVSTPWLKAVPLTLSKFMLGRITIDNKILYGTVFFWLSVLVAFLVWLSWKKKKKPVVALSIFILVPILSVFLASFILPVIAPQRVLFTLPFLLILLASGIQSVDKEFRPIALIAVMIPSIFGLTLYYTNPRFQREQWRQATTFVEGQSNAQTVVLFAFPEPFAPFLWYRKTSLGIGAAKEFVVKDSDLKNLAMHLESNYEAKNKVFFFQYLTDLTDPQKKIPSFLSQRGFKLSDTHDFPGVGFIYEYRKERN